MIERNIKLADLDSVKVFVSATAQLSCDVDLKSDRFIVDGKSILGIFSLNLAHPICLQLYTDPCEESETFFKNIQEFLV